MLKRTVKSIVSGGLSRFGLKLSRTGKPVERSATPDEIAVQTVKEAEFYRVHASRSPLFTPWVGHPEYLEFCEGVSEHTLVSAERCYTLMGLAKHARLLAGEFAECGVYRGGTALILARITRGTGKTLHLFDSFAGLPPEHERDNFYKGGQFSGTSVARIETLLGPGHLSHTRIHPGWIPDTFAGLEGQRFAFAHIDVDLYQSALDCCRFFYPRMPRGGILLFDDYGFPSCRGEKDAVDEFFADKPECPITLATGQGMAIKATE